MFRPAGRFCQNLAVAGYANAQSPDASILMYSLTLLTHSWLRWAVLAAAVVALVRSARGQGTWSRADDRAGLLFSILLDVQVLLGLLLYFPLSPLMAGVRAQMADAMRNDALRYWLIEHPFGMLVAVVLAHVGRARIRKAADPRRKHRLALIFFGLALVAIVVAIPWPGMPTARPLVRIP